jgi:GTP pyrophosphokinase
MSYHHSKKERILMIDSPVTRAFQLAAELHAQQTRKASIVPGTPYLSHLMEVAAIVMAIDPNEEVVAAALLHDVIEDQGAETRDLVRAQLGARVLALVEECTEPDTGGTAKAPWLERKRGYLEHVRSASLEALIITCADKLQNLRDLRKQVVVYGESAYSSFHAGKADKLWFYNAVLDAARQRATEFKAQQPASPIFVALNYLFYEQEELLSYLRDAHVPLDA